MDVIASRRRHGGQEPAKRTLKPGYFKFSRIQRFQSFGTNSPFLRINCRRNILHHRPFGTLISTCPNAPPSGCRCRIPHRPGRGEVQRTGDFFSNKMSHSGSRSRVDPSENSHHVTRAGVGVQNSLSRLELFAMPLITWPSLNSSRTFSNFVAGVKRRRVELDHAVHGIFHRTRKDFAVGNVAGRPCTFSRRCL